ncbi:MAG: septum site-determining protein MinC [Legionellales bacterium]|nr:septum site-determining protein MinC [Legionellales bacterium]
METNTITQEHQAIQFKGTMFSLTVLTLNSNDFSAIQNHVKQTVKKAPKMFHHAPVVIDLGSNNQLTATLAVAPLIDMLQQHQILPIAIMGGSAEQQKTAIQAGLTIFPAAKHTVAASPARSPSSSRAPKRTGNTKIISQPVRSGQQIYAQGSDLVILASVSHGAEIISDGSIHVYGALHGRAIAGSSGNLDARIFCTKLDAELISIAGIYSLSDDYTNKKLDAPMQIFLENNQLVITELK